VRAAAAQRRQSSARASLLVWHAQRRAYARRGHLSGRAVAIYPRVHAHRLLRDAPRACGAQNAEIVDLLQRFREYSFTLCASAPDRPPGALRCGAPRRQRH
jgi:hypothetical protein